MRYRAIGRTRSATSDPGAIARDGAFVILGLPAGQEPGVASVDLLCMHPTASAAASSFSVFHTLEYAIMPRGGDHVELCVVPRQADSDDAHTCASSFWYVDTKYGFPDSSTM